MTNRYESGFCQALARRAAKLKRPLDGREKVMDAAGSAKIDTL